MTGGPTLDELLASSGHFADPGRRVLVTGASTPLGERLVRLLLTDSRGAHVLAITGEPACLSRARVLWNISRVFTMLSINLLILGHVVAGLWSIWFG
jgi:hypothetical protein